jgi:hypothetical protein
MACVPSTARTLIVAGISRSCPRADRLTRIRSPPTLGLDMKPDSVVKHFLLAFVLALVGYVAFYLGIEHGRTRNGPWQVAFTNSATGAPALMIDQPRLGITNVQVHFPGETLATAIAPGAFPKEDSPSTNSSSPFATLLFAQPKPVPYSVPFGTCVFMDTTFLPGTVTFRLFDHEIELLPRVLIIDHEEHPWQPNATISLPRARDWRTVPNG